MQTRPDYFIDMETESTENLRTVLNMSQGKHQIAIAKGVQLNTIKAQYEVIRQALHKNNYHLLLVLTAWVRNVLLTTNISYHYNNYESAKSLFQQLANQIIIIKTLFENVLNQEKIDKPVNIAMRIANEDGSEKIEATHKIDVKEAIILQKALKKILATLEITQENNVAILDTIAIKIPLFQLSNSYRIASNSLILKEIDDYSEDLSLRKPNTFYQGFKKYWGDVFSRVTPGKSFLAVGSITFISTSDINIPGVQINEQQLFYFCLSIISLVVVGFPLSWALGGMYSWLFSGEPNFLAVPYSDDDLKQDKKAVSNMCNELNEQVRIYQEEEDLRNSLDDEFDRVEELERSRLLSPTVLGTSGYRLSPTESILSSNSSTASTPQNQHPDVHVNISPMNPHVNLKVLSPVNTDTTVATPINSADNHLKVSSVNNGPIPTTALQHRSPGALHTRNISIKIDKQEMSPNEHSHKFANKKLSRGLFSSSPLPKTPATNDRKYHGQQAKSPKSGY